MTHSLLLRLVLSGSVVLLACSTLSGQDPAKKQDSPTEAKKKLSFENSPAGKALEPLFKRVRTAQSTRVTVQLSAETVIDGAVINTEESTYQIASKAPDQFTVYLKSKQVRTRIYCSGKSMTIALSPSAYTELDEVVTLQQAVFQLPIPMGPYPEAVMALTLAGVDPMDTFIAGMKSLDEVDRKPFRGKTPSIHFSGLQDDEVRWDLWVSQGSQPKPLRLLVDLTDMLRINGSLEMPPGYRYLLRFNFDAWHVNTRTDPSLFNYKPIPNAKKYDTIEAYFEELSKEPAAEPEKSETSSKKDE